MHPKGLNKLPDVILRSLSIIFERSWQLGEVIGEWKRADFTPIFRKGKKEEISRELEANQLYLSSWEGCGSNPLRSHFYTHERTWLGAASVGLRYCFLSQGDGTVNGASHLYCPLCRTSQQVCRWYQIGGSGWYAGGPECSLEQPAQAR